MTVRRVAAGVARKPYRERLVGIAAGLFASVIIAARVISMFGSLLDRASLVAVTAVAVCAAVAAIAAGPMISVGRLHAAAAALAGVGCAAVGALAMAMGPLWVLYMLFSAVGWALDTLLAV